MDDQGYGDLGVLFRNQRAKAANRGVEAGRRNNTGILYFEGYFRVPEDGDYTFYLKAGVKALLRIHEATGIDADYNYTGGMERTASIRLKAGLHPFRRYDVRKKGTPPLLDVEWSGPGISKQQIPDKVFFHDS